MLILIVTIKFTLFDTITIVLSNNFRHALYIGSYISIFISNYLFKSS